MNEQQALQKMIPPGARRPGKYMQGVIQIWVTRHCDKACFGCTQGSNLTHALNREKSHAEGGHKVQAFITVDQFEDAVLSLKDYFGVVGVFGGNPAIHPRFEDLCLILQKHIPYQRRGLWCNNPMGKGAIMRQTFNPAHSNLNVHLDGAAYDEFKRDWPECHPVGLTEDSRHSPPYVAMKDVITRKCPDCHGRGYNHSCGCDEPDCNIPIPCNECNETGRVLDESAIWELASNCDINKHWSAMVGVFRGELRAWFCEIAGAQAMLHQHEPDYPDTGMPVLPKDSRTALTSKHWWEWPMEMFNDQARKHCFDCGIPLRGRGELAQANDHSQVILFPEDRRNPLVPTGPMTVVGPKEQVSATHEGIYKPKRAHRHIEVVTDLQQLGTERLHNITKYIQNAKV